MNSQAEIHTRKFWELSTAHVTPVDLALAPASRMFHAHNYVEGTSIFLFGSSFENDDFISIAQEGYSSFFMTILHAACREGVDILNFDADAELVEAFPDVSQACWGSVGRDIPQLGQATPFDFWPGDFERQARSEGWRLTVNAAGFVMIYPNGDPENRLITECHAHIFRSAQMGSGLHLLALFLSGHQASVPLAIGPPRQFFNARYENHFVEMAEEEDTAQVDERIAHLELEHMGSEEAQTGIYHPDNRQRQSGTSTNTPSETEISTAIATLSRIVPTLGRAQAVRDLFNHLDPNERAQYDEDAIDNYVRYAEDIPLLLWDVVSGTDLEPRLSLWAIEIAGTGTSTQYSVLQILDREFSHGEDCNSVNIHGSCDCIRGTVTAYLAAAAAQPDANLGTPVFPPLLANRPTTVWRNRVMTTDEARTVLQDLQETVRLTLASDNSEGCALLCRIITETNLDSQLCVAALDAYRARQRTATSLFQELENQFSHTPQCCLHRIDNEYDCNCVKGDVSSYIENYQEEPLDVLAAWTDAYSEDRHGCELLTLILDVIGVPETTKEFIRENRHLGTPVPEIFFDMDHNATLMSIDALPHVRGCDRFAERGSVHCTCYKHRVEYYHRAHPYSPPEEDSE